MKRGGWRGELILIKELTNKSNSLTYINKLQHNSKDVKISSRLWSISTNERIIWAFHVSFIPFIFRTRLWDLIYKSMFKTFLSEASGSEGF